ncbi:MAG TPA: DUF1223 domain-containing protein [Phenylobacterium sp.]|jgi:hypothetical protein|nr:DUF1223 domain-containing protein [Phenylobacterium sp.]
MVRLALPLAAALMALALAAPDAARAADVRHPALVELFTSQGCSSCPPAEANIGALADRPEILALSFGVTYWDDLGWKDTFAKPAFTARQWDYARGLGHKNVFTPQVVVNGRKDGVGNDARALAQLIRAADRGVAGPALEIVGAQARIGAATAPAPPAEVWLARYDPRVVQVPIRRGENGGKTLPQRNVVRELVRLGVWRGTAETLRLPPLRDPALRSAVFLQLPKGGPILAAARG